jgi:hypothetical protein
MPIVQQSEVSPFFSHCVRDGHMLARAEEDSRHRFRKRNSEAFLLRLNFELSYPPFRYPDPGEDSQNKIAKDKVYCEQSKSERICGVPLKDNWPQNHPKEEIQDKQSSELKDRISPTGCHLPCFLQGIVTKSP